MNEHDIHPTHSAARRSDSNESPARRVFARGPRDRVDRPLPLRAFTEIVKVPQGIQAVGARVR
jgi:hypothetical protein